jgi:hypothetical protein
MQSRAAVMNAVTQSVRSGALGEPGAPSASVDDARRRDEGPNNDVPIGAVLAGADTVILERRSVRVGHDRFGEGVTSADRRITGCLAPIPHRG